MANDESCQVDMIAAARNAQWTADRFLGAGSIKLVAPAKINLFLGVGERRSDGYHDVTNVMHAVSLHDVLYMSLAPFEGDELDAGVGGAGLHAGAGCVGRGDAAGRLATDWDGSSRAATDPAAASDHVAWTGPVHNVRVTIDVADKTAAGTRALSIPARDNIACRAIGLLAERANIRERFQVNMRLEKHIPHEGGLGGGSSDAAAALVGAAALWGLDPDDGTLEDVARCLGSDVAFFLHGGCALYAGAGEVRVGALDSARLPLVLVKPSAGVSTPAAYRAFDEHPREVPAALAQRVAAARRAQDVPLFNNLAAASEGLAPVLFEVRRWLAEQQGVEDPDRIILCGSGATTAAFTRDFAAACAIAAAAQARGWWARATTLSSLRAAVVR